MEEGISESLQCRFQRYFLFTQFCSLLSLYLFFWRGFLLHAVTNSWQWSWIQMQITPHATVGLSGCLGNSFRHWHNFIECALQVNSKSQLNLFLRLILKVSTASFLLYCPDTACLCVPLRLLQLYPSCCCITKRQKEWNRLIARGPDPIYRHGQAWDYILTPDAAEALYLYQTLFFDLREENKCLSLGFHPSFLYMLRRH